MHSRWAKSCEGIYPRQSIGLRSTEDPGRMRNRIGWFSVGQKPKFHSRSIVTITLEVPLTARILEKRARVRRPRYITARANIEVKCKAPRGPPLSWGDTAILYFYPIIFPPLLAEFFRKEEKE
ncbi:hypothetical protein KM043_003616 [Ampulex compressa]|nr:hypothetical protein KM043_003616 [Ampulex compressa]